MPRLIEYMSVGICASYGDGDYKVSCGAAELTPDQVREIRQIIPVAIATLEKYLQEAIEKSRPQGSQAGIISSESRPTPIHK